jgi:hypothetical protein
MKKLLIVVLAATLVPILASGCGGSDKDKGINSNKDKPKADKGG